MMKRFALVIGLIGLCGCTTWPSYGTGGMDEVYHYDRDNLLSHTHFSEVGPIKVVAKELDHMRAMIDRSWKSAAGKYRPATLTLIDIQWGRVAREFAAHMHVDAFESLKVLKKMFLDMENDLEAETSDRAVAAAENGQDK